MNRFSPSSKGLTISLWVVQLLLAGSLVWAVFMKTAQPVDQLAALWPWTAQVPRSFVYLTALFDSLGALGLILPTLFNIRPRLTSWAALGLVGLMIGAIIFHVSRGEASLIGINIGFIVLAFFVAWGRALPGQMTA